MNIYNLIPLVAVIAYVPLLATTVSARPWSKRHKLFLLFLVAAVCWSLVDFITRSDFFPQFRFLWLKIILLMFCWMCVQFHYFTSSFYPPGKGRWLIFAYASLALIIVLLAVGFSEENILVEGEKLSPQYGRTTIVMMVPLLVLLARNLYIFIPLMKHQENPIVFNQSVTLVITLVVLAFFALISLLPYGREFPLSHIGNIANAFILSYAVVGHKLVDIRFVLRRGFAWLSIGVIALTCFWAIELGFHHFFDTPLTLASTLAASVSCLAALVIIYKLRNLISRFTGQALQGESYHFREKLLSYAKNIHFVFSLKEQGSELLALVTRAVGCSKTGLLFLNPGEDFETQLTEPPGKDNSLACLRIRGDNPIIDYLKRERHPLTRENIATLPEFLGLWQQEKEVLTTSGIELFVPLISRDKLIGILVLDNKKNGRYNLEDYSLLEEITGRVAVSMEKEFLREQLKVREEELSVINRSNAIFTSSLDIQRIYDNFIRELKRVVDVDWAAISVIEGSEIYFVAVSTEIGTPWKVGEHLPFKGTATEWVVNNNRPLIIPQLTEETGFPTVKYLTQLNIHSIAYLPLMISNQVIGTLAVASRNSHAYSSRHLKLLEQLASQIAMPIENARLYAKTERLARVDSLTGLLNRRSLDEMLPREIGRHSRYGGVFSMIIFDLDAFKSLNDNYGHLTGDEILRQLGNIINNTIREADQAFRYGGDEFAILLPQTSMEAAFKVAERIRLQTFARIEIDSKPVSISLGLANWPADGVSPNDILGAADIALYKAKRSGGNCSICSSVSLTPVQNIKDVIKVPDRRDSGALSTIFALAATVDTREQASHNHTNLVHDYAIAIGEEMHLNALEINRLSTCALLHDIGKIGINDEILNKQNALTSEEWQTIKAHPSMGAAIISHYTQLIPCVSAILHHHERFDGEGYPDGLKGAEIPLEARILAIADSFAAMTTARVYSKALSYEAAIEEIKSFTGTQFDPDLVEIFLRVIPKTIASSEKAGTGSESN